MIDARGKQIQTEWLIARWNYLADQLLLKEGRLRAIVTQKPDLESRADLILAL